MAVGVLVETFVVRSLLVPALVALFGYTAGWPGRRIRTGVARLPGGDDMSEPSDDSTARRPPSR